MGDVKTQVTSPLLKCSVLYMFRPCEGRTSSEHRPHPLALVIPFNTSEPVVSLIRPRSPSVNHVLMTACLISCINPSFPRFLCRSSTRAKRSRGSRGGVQDTTATSCSLVMMVVLLLRPLRLLPRPLACLMLMAAPLLFTTIVAAASASAARCGRGPWRSRSRGPQHRTATCRGSSRHAAATTAAADADRRALGWRVSVRSGGCQRRRSGNAVHTDDGAGTAVMAVASYATKELPTAGRHTMAATSVSLSTATAP